MTDWPTDLPQAFLRDGFGKKAADNIIRSPMAVGPAKIRRRSTAGVGEYNGSFRMTEAQLQTFEAFWVSDLKQGSLTFRIPAPFSAAPGGTALVRFKEPYSVSPMGVDWRVGMVLEILP